MLHKRYDFTQLGGFPLTQNRLKLMQEAYDGIDQALVSIIGDDVILSGCEVSEDAGTYTVTDGWIISSGKLVPFIGGESSDTFFRIATTTNSLVFEDATSKEVEFIISASLNLSGTVRIGDLIRIEQLFKDISVASEDIADGVLTGTKYDVQWQKTFGKYLAVSMTLKPDTTELDTSGEDSIVITGFPHALNSAFRAAFLRKSFLTISKYSGGTVIANSSTTADCNITIPSSGASLTIKVACSELAGWFATPSDYRARINFTAFFKIA